MTSVPVPGIFSIIVNNNRTGLILLAGPIVFLTVLLFHNFILALEFKSIKHFETQILHIDHSLIQVKAAYKISKVLFHHSAQEGKTIFS